jgi:hypothetical protein
MSVILIFLTLVVLIIFFYREIILALIALLGFLSARTDFLERCVQGLRESLASPPVSFGGALVLSGFFVFVLLTSEWLLRAGWLCSRPVKATVQRRPPATIVDLPRLESEVLADGPLGSKRPSTGAPKADQRPLQRPTSAGSISRFSCVVEGSPSTRAGQCVSPFIIFRTDPAPQTLRGVPRRPRRFEASKTHPAASNEA